MLEFNNKSRPKNKNGKDRERDTYESTYALYEGRELVRNAFKIGIFPINATKGKGLKILAPKQMFQRLQIAHAQVKAGKTFKTLLNKMIQIIYSLYRARKVLKSI